MNKSHQLISIPLVLLAAMACARAEPPERFDTREEALKHECQLQPLKGKEIECAVLTEFDGHDLIIFIYDQMPDGSYERKHRLCITSWYWMAKVGYEDLLGDGRKFLRVESEGNTGTGTLQKILSYWGWHDGEFVPVLFETVSYGLVCGTAQRLHAKISLKNPSLKDVFIGFDYDYTYEDPGIKSTLAWSESLSWNEASFSFYRREDETRKLLKPDNYIHKNIIQARINLLDRKCKIEPVGTETLNALQIMQVLNDNP